VPLSGPGPRSRVPRQAGSKTQARSASGIPPQLSATAGLVVHTGLKSRTVIRSLRTRGLLRELRIDTAHTEPEPPDASDLVSPAPAAPTISRRGALAFAGAGSLVLLALSAGQSLGGPLRRTALLAPHGQDLGGGPNDFQINQTADQVGIRKAETGASWRLTLS